MIRHVAPLSMYITSHPKVPYMCNITVRINHYSYFNEKKITTDYEIIIYHYFLRGKKYILYIHSTIKCKSCVLNE